MGLDWQQDRPWDTVHVELGCMVRIKWRHTLGWQTVIHQEVLLQYVTVLPDVIGDQRRPDVAWFSGRV